MIGIGLGLWMCCQGTGFGPVPRAYINQDGAYFIDQNGDYFVQQ